jgi:hypothetical protein
MSSPDTFPLPFRSLSTLSGGKERGYILAALFTPEFTGKARHLAASCEVFGVPYVMHEIAAVHTSIHSQGSADPSFTKANFIHHVLNQHNKPVLYVDADCEFLDEPKLLNDLVASGCDFAIYNWFADEHTDAFAPVEISLSGKPPIRDRFYTYTHSVEFFAPDQLMCSGLVQYYGNSESARMLLREWQRTIVAFSGCSDDSCLDFTFNNLGTRKLSVRIRWLPKAYARISWWIYAKPVINNAYGTDDQNIFIPVKDSAGRQRFYLDRVQKRNEVRLFPRDCIIDTEQRVILRLVNNEFVVVSPTDQNFWL